MLKLLRYELKSLSKGLLPIYGGVLLVALLNRFIFGYAMGQNMDLGLLSSVMVITVFALYLIFIVGVAVMTVIVTVLRFYQDLLSDGGYLMHTLPVSTHALLLSKLFGAVIMTLISLLVGGISLIIFASYSDLWGAFFSQPWGAIFREAFHQMPSWPLVIVELFILVVVSLANGTLFYYLSMALGHLSKKHRVLMAIVWYLVLTTILTFIEGVAFAMLGNSPLLDYFNASINSIHPLLLGSIAVMMVLNIIFYLPTWQILKNRLNLQ